MPETLNGEATPQTNTAGINPLTFDEAALAKALKHHFEPPAAVEPPKEKPPEEPPVEPAEPEAPAEPPAETEQVVEPPEGQEPPEGTTEEPNEETDPSAVQKRINKLTAQKKEAQEKAEALEREVNDLKVRLEGLEATPPATPDAANPFSNIFEESKLREEWDKARMVKRWCEDNVDGCEFNGREYTAEEVKQIRRRTEDALEVGIPQRAAFLHRYREVKPEAERIYPFWKDRGSPEYTDAQAVLRALPAITNNPEYQILIGDFLVGRQLRLAKARQPRPAAVAKALPPKAPKQPTTPVSPARQDGEQAQYEARKKKFLKGQTVDDLAQVLKGRL
jgi:outer membrane biosynthesis protein TonB